MGVWAALIEQRFGLVVAPVLIGMAGAEIRERITGKGQGCSLGHFP
jgi:hypothetical protein